MVNYQFSIINSQIASSAHLPCHPKNKLLSPIAKEFRRLFSRRGGGGMSNWIQSPLSCARPPTLEGQSWDLDNIYITGKRIKKSVRWALIIYTQIVLYHTKYVTFTQNPQKTQKRTCFACAWPPECVHSANADTRESTMRALWILWIPCETKDWISREIYSII